MVAGFLCAPLCPLWLKPWNCSPSTTDHANRGTILNAHYFRRTTLEPHDVVSAIHVDSITRDAGTRVGREKYSGAADFAALDVALQWRPFGMRFQHVAET